MTSLLVLFVFIHCYCFIYYAGHSTAPCHVLNKRSTYITYLLTTFECADLQICSFRELFSGRFTEDETSFLLERFHGDLQDTINFVMHSQFATVLMLALHAHIYSTNSLCLLSKLAAYEYATFVAQWRTQ